MKYFHHVKKYQTKSEVIIIGLLLCVKIGNFIVLSYNNIIIAMKVVNVCVSYIMGLLFLFELAETASSVNPTWTPNVYFEAMPAVIKTDITTSFGSANPRTVTFPFTKTYTAIPQLAFGIKNYRGIVTSFN